MQFDRKDELPEALIDMVRAHTSGDVSARRHQASRARVLDRWTEPKRTGTFVLGAVVGTFALGTAAFAGMMAMKPHHPHGAPPVPAISASAEKTDDGDAEANNVAEVANANEDEDKDKDKDEDAHAIVVSVEPDGATVFWDDEPVPGGWLDRQPDHKTHRVRAEATGYITKTQIVVADSPKIRLELKLQPLPATIGPVTASGAIPNADEIVEGMRDQLQNCYTEGLGLDASLKGKATLTLRVGPDGHVSASDVSENDGLSAKVTTCLAYTATDAEFRESEKGGVVRIPIAFGLPTTK